MKIYRMSRDLDKTDPCFKNFVLGNNLWPTLGSTNKDLDGFTAHTIKTDKRGHIIASWQRLVLRELLREYRSCDLYYSRSTGRQIFSISENDLIFFKLKWSF